MPLLNTADALYVGASAVDAVYYGSTLVWPSAFNPLTYLSWHSAYWAEDPDWTNPGDGNAVSSWRDGSGNGRTVSQGTGTRQPIYRATGIGSQPGVQFDGTDDWLASSSSFTATTGDLTKVMVLKPTATNSGRHFWSRGASGGRADGFVWGTAWGAYSPATGIFSGGTVNTNAHLVIITFATAAEIVVDGTQVATDSGSASLSGHTLASEPGGGSPWAGYIAFAGLYNGTLTSGQKADLLAWAQDHYGV